MTLIGRMKMPGSSDVSEGSIVLECSSLQLGMTPAEIDPVQGQE
jgi:hypothetical protein